MISAFAIVILSVIGGLFYNNHETMVGSISDPEDGKAYVTFHYLYSSIYHLSSLDTNYIYSIFYLFLSVATTIFGAVGLYVLFFLFCGCQIFVMQRQSKIQL